MVKRVDSAKTKIKRGEVDKNSPVLEAVGSLDELSSLIGLLKAKTTDKETKKLLLNIQRDLKGINSVLAGYENKSFSHRTRFLEKRIALWQKQLPRLTGFVFPGENELSGLSHLCRTVCRRAERRVISLSKEEKVRKCILDYLNRLSEFFFVLSRNLEKEG